MGARTSERAPGRPVRGETGAGIGPVRSFRSIFISDVHLGSARSKANTLLDFLGRTESRFLYFVGDLVDSWGEEGLAAWPAPHVEVLSTVREKARCGTRVSYLSGNHDGLFGEHWPSWPVRPECAAELEHVTADGRRFLVAHGERFDGLIQRAGWLLRLGEIVAACLESLSRVAGRPWRALCSGRSGPAALAPRRLCKRLSGYTRRFASRAVRSAEERSFDGVICGHVHEPSSREIGGVLYLNGGDWVQSCSALVEHDDGRLEVLRWPCDRVSG